MVFAHSMLLMEVHVMLCTLRRSDAIDCSLRSAGVGRKHFRNKIIIAQQTQWVGMHVAE